MNEISLNRISKIREFFALWDLATANLNINVDEEDVSIVSVAGFNASETSRRNKIALAQIASEVFIVLKQNPFYLNRWNNHLFFSKNGFLLKESLNRLEMEYGPVKVNSNIITKSQ